LIRLMADATLPNAAKTNKVASIYAK